MNLPTLTRAQIAQAALRLEDVPFSHHGRNLEVGLDCAGVLVATFLPFGVRLWEESLDYPRMPKQDYILRCLGTNFIAKHKGQFAKSVHLASYVENGDVLHIKFKRDSQARHLAIAVKDREMMIVHALKQARQVLVEPLSGLLTDAEIFGIYQWPRLQS